MPVTITNITKTRINNRLVKEITLIFLKKYKFDNCEVEVSFVGDMSMKKLNKLFRGADKVTDVLAFPVVSQDNFFSNNYYLGEIIIDVPQIKRQAKYFSPNFKSELLFILIHGLLHLIGREDNTSSGKEAMIKEGQAFFRGIKKYDKI